MNPRRRPASEADIQKARLQGAEFMFTVIIHVCKDKLAIPDEVLQRVNMGELIEIKDYLKICDNCKWGSRDGSGACLRPGGWHWTIDYWHCDDFKQKKENSKTER